MSRSWVQFTFTIIFLQRVHQTITAIASQTGKEIYVGGVSRKLASEGKHVISLCDNCSSRIDRTPQ